MRAPSARLRVGVCVLPLLGFTMQQAGDSLDEMRAFKPEDKYFKAGLVSLHFFIETHPVEQLGEAFADTLKRYGLPADAKGCLDGTYTGSSPYDAYDYRHVVHIEIRNQKIISVDYDEIHRSGQGKQSDVDYNEEMSVTGTKPAVAYPVMEQDLVDKQDLMQVDGVSGASYSLYRFRYAVMIALTKARLAAAQQPPDSSPPL